MGATSWHYLVAYDQDAGRALKSLRERVFREGAFRPPPVVVASEAAPFVAEEYLRSVIEALKGSSDPAAVRCCRVVECMIAGADAQLTDPDDVAVRNCFRGEIRRLQKPNGRRRVPKDPIAQILAVCGEQGSHSILDIERVARRKAFGVAVPLSDRALLQVFGTLHPNRDQVQELWGEVTETLRAWEAVFFTVYVEGVPKELAFVGCSGD